MASDPKKALKSQADAVQFFSSGAIEAAMEGAAQGLTMCLQDLEAVGVQKAPIKTGWLRQNIKYAKPLRDGQNYSLAGSVGAHTDYAYIQHENPQFSHPKGGEAYYLTRPLEQNSNKYTELIADKIGKALQKATKQ